MVRQATHSGHISRHKHAQQSNASQLDAQPLSALMDLLAQVRPTAVYPRTRAGI